MKVLHLLTSGGIGGIEILCKDIAANSEIENIFCFMFGEGAVYEQMKMSGYQVHSLDDNKKISAGKFNSLKDIARPCDIVVVHHNDPFLEMYYLLLMKVCPQKKYVSMVHHCYNPAIDDIDYGFIKKQMKKRIQHAMFKKSDALIFVSKAGLDSYTEHFQIDGKKAYVVYNGIGNKYLDAGKNVVKENHDKVRILYAGRLVALKGVDDLIEVLPKIIAHIDVCVEIVGDGNCREELEKKVSELGLKDCITFHGFKNDITPYLAKTDVFVYPSRTEIFGLSIVEAMAFKCVCVANNVGGIPEILVNNVNGYLNVSNTIEGLEEAIFKAVDSVKDGRIRDCIVQEARKTAERFSISNTIKNLEEIYSTLMIC